MLQAKDLMIGDWVTCDKDYYQVLAIFTDPNEVYVRGKKFSIRLAIEDVEPIPLTPEILEKNGFKVYEQDFTSNTVYEFGSLDYMEFERFHKYFNIGSKTTYRHFGIEDTYIHSLMRIYFVHELQHALKLCGIKKEIIL